MIWIDSISQLQYYNQPKGVPCYCEIVVYPSDMTLQGVFNPNPGAYTMLVEVMSADGLTVYENATTYFEYYFFVNPITNLYSFNLRLKSFSPQMCVRACYILRVRVSNSSGTIFDRYTERYCQSSCCDLARDIRILQDGTDITTPIVLSDPATALLVATPVTEYPKTTECGDRLITLTSRFECYDNFSGDYYATPDNVLQGTASFTFYKFTNMRGKIVPRPMSISREYSYNCRLQKVQSQAVYALQGFEYFPAWKMREIEGQLHANEIYVDSVRYEYNGGEPFTQPTTCLEIFRLNTELSDCTIRQIFGCPQPCITPTNFDGAQAMFVVPANYTGGYFYNENGVVIGDYDDLLNYYRGLDGATALNEINVGSPLACYNLIYGAFSVNSYGYIPSSFYYDSVSQQNRVYSQVVADIDDICNPLNAICDSPVLGDIIVEDQTCDAPVLGDIIIEDMAGEDVNIDGQGNWDIVTENTFVKVYNGYVTMDLDVRNLTIFENPDDPGENFYIAAQIVALLGVTGRPQYDITFNSDNSGLTEGTSLTIKSNGQIIYSGDTTNVSDTHIEVIVNNINYNI